MPRFWWYDNDIDYYQNHQSKNFGNDSRTIYFSNFFLNFGSLIFEISWRSTEQNIELEKKNSLRKKWTLIYFIRI